MGTFRRMGTGVAVYGTARGMLGVCVGAWQGVGWL